MITRKRREVEVFSLSFMDVICCGFGAILLIFLLTTGQRTNYNERDLTELHERIDQLASEIDREKDEIERLKQIVVVTDLTADELREKNARDQQRLTEREKELQLLLQELANLNEAIARLMEMEEHLPTQEELAAIPIPQVDRRHYLTGFRLEGEYILFLVRASGSMLDETIDDVLVRLQEPEFQKREAPKWKRTLDSLTWMIATLDPETQFQIMLFNEETVPVLPDRADEWFNPRDRSTVYEIVTRLKTVVPHGAANLERAFTAVRFMPRLPDSVVMITDGLPTTSDSIPIVGDVTNQQRVNFFSAAVRQLPPRIPVSTILLPLSGDPAAPALYWELANITRGALVSPAPSWPDL